jgi:hypothetical protein
MVDPKKPVPGNFEFEWAYSEEPHRSRRIAILAKYGPEVRDFVCAECRISA